MKLLLFDVDMTLISTGGAGIRALNRAFRELFGFENAMNGILPHGKTDPGIIREIFSAQGNSGAPDSMEQILESYLKYLRAEVENSESYLVLPGVLPLLDFLMPRSDVLLGLATGNVELGARIKLERGKLNRYFKFGGYGSDFEDRVALVRRGAELGALRCGQSMDPRNVFVIGDTPLDIAAGRAAGFCTIGVATGRFTTADLKQAGATAALTDFERDHERFFRMTGIE